MSITNIVTSLRDIKENIAGLSEEVRGSLGIEPGHVDEFITRFEGHADRELAVAEKAAVKAFSVQWFADGCPAVTDPAQKVLLAKFMAS